MSDIAIHVENLGKVYRLGHQHKRPDMLREAFTDALRYAWQQVTGKANDDSETTLWALRGVSFQVQRGQVVGVIGRNGAGKSTLLKILSRITEPTEGHAQIRGRVGSLLEVGTGFHPELTGRDNIYLNGAILGMQRAEIEAKFDEIVAFSEIEKFLDTPVKRYSSGMYVRLAFAVAAHLETEVLLVDEVLAVGDVAFQRKCLDKMGDVARQGRTVLFVSHNLAMVAKLCSRTLWLQDGGIAADGESQATITRYLESTRNNQGGAGQYYQLDRKALERQNAPGISIRDIELCKADGSPLSAMRMGDGLLVRIHFDATQPLPSPGFVVALRSHDGVELCRVSNMPISGYPIDSLDGPGHIQVTFPSLPFTGGRYYVSIRVIRVNMDFLLTLEDIAWFDIEPGDAYGSGFAMTTRQGFITLPHYWAYYPHDQVDT